jgi:hypothetical protein
LITAFEDLQRAAASGLRGRQVALDQQPNTDHIDVPLIVPQPIPETLDPFDILNDIAKPLNGIARRHALSRGLRFPRHAASASLPRPGPPDGRSGLQPVLDANNVK